MNEKMFLKKANER